MNQLPPVQGLRTVRFKDALNHHIITALIADFDVAVKQTRQFAQKFKGATAEDSAKNVWNFLRSKIKYQRDPAEVQQIRLPNRFINDRAGDCKSYSLLAASVLYNLGIPVSFRFAGYRNDSTVPTHVYVYLPDHNIIVDGVYNHFNAEKLPTLKFDKDLSSNNKMEVVTLSGVNGGFSLKEILIENHKRRKAGMKPLRNVPRQTLLNYVRRNFKAGSPTYMLALRELKNIHGYDELDGIEGIGKIKLKKFFKKVGKAIKKGVKSAGKALKKVGLAAPRKAYLQIVRLNIKGIASKLALAVEQNKSKVESKWKKLGGNPSVLLKAIKAGSRKKSLGNLDEYNSVGADPALGTILTAAGPILIAMGSLLKVLKPKDKDGNIVTDDGLQNEFEAYGGDSGDASTAAAAGETYYARGGGDDPDDAKDIPGEDEESAGLGFKLSPAILIGGAAAAYLLFKKK